jgi:hypothetical protein
MADLDSTSSKKLKLVDGQHKAFVRGRSCLDAINHRSWLSHDWRGVPLICQPTNHPEEPCAIFSSRSYSQLPTGQQIHQETSQLVNEVERGQPLQPSLTALC